jgi:glycosyltransferase involved in cell wall biosynthesis
MSVSRANSVGLVAIGRNEGERLRVCLESAFTCTPRVVYVDSGSNDDSVNMARHMGAEVVTLDLTSPFTAARARNAGIDCLRNGQATPDFVQVVDGDCELAPDWISQAMQFLDDHPRCAIVCGRRRERDPESSKYNCLCDLEWNTPVGQANACGGDAMIRMAAIQHAGLYNPSIIAGEEPEFCLRLRQAGWLIVRLDHEMTIHDARITRFDQWWRRMVRSGYAYAQGMAMHGIRAGSERYCVREVGSIVFWAMVVPLLILSLALPLHGWSAVGLLMYVVLAWRIARGRLNRGDSRAHAWLYACYCVIGKFAQLQGLVQFALDRVRGRKRAIIEYKSPAEPQSGEWNLVRETGP